MEHAIGYDQKSSRCSHGKRYYVPYRNYYGAGNIHEVWENLVEKGLAETADHSCYSVTNKGLAELSKENGVHIYSDNAYGTYEAKRAVFKAILDNDAAIVPDLWFPISCRQVSQNARIPITKTRECVKLLIDEGLIVKSHAGGQDENGNIYCRHGFTASDEGEKDPYFYEANRREVDRVFEIIEGGGKW